ncbi:cytochrome c [bacterium]|nr:MAG: cytochrome c [bacterium]
MWRQTTTDPMDESTFYADGSVNRPLQPGTIARGHLRKDDAFFTGARNGQWVTEIPMQLSQQDLRNLMARGQDRFNAYCTPCHGQLGDGQGMIAHRGFNTRRPVGNFHTERLQNMPIGHFYDVITNGYGAMYSYASRVEPHDRWAIAAYIRALQLSQNASLADADPQLLSEYKAPAPFDNPSAPSTPMQGGQP